MKYETRPVPAVPVDAVQFFPDKDGRSNTWHVGLYPCYCDAMDSVTCGQHEEPPRYTYVLRGTVHIVNPGDWVVGLFHYSPEEFNQRYRAVTNGEGEKDQTLV